MEGTHTFFYCLICVIILNKIKKVQSGLPSAPERVVNKAESEIKKEHSSNNWENKEQLLPPDLMRFSREN